MVLFRITENEPSKMHNVRPYVYSRPWLALKKTANNEVYEHIKTVFDKLRSTTEFKSLNEKNRNQTYVIITSLVYLCRLEQFSHC